MGRRATTGLRAQTLTLEVALMPMRERLRASLGVLRAAARRREILY